MKLVLSLALALLLSACTVPPMMMATTAVEGASAMTTGKTATDYAISAVTDRDCTLLYGLTRGQVCRDPVDSDETLTAAMGASAVPVEADVHAAPARPAESDDASPAPAAQTPSWTLVLGTVEDYAQAVTLARRLKPKAGLITAVEIDGKVAYRVTTEPFAFEQAVNRQKEVASQDFANAVLSAVCPHWMKDEKCIVLDRILPL